MRLIVEQPIGGKDFDESADAWEFVTSEYFNVKPLRANEREQAQQMQSNITHVATCGYFRGANTSMRLRNDDRTFHVLSVINIDERNRLLEWRLAEAEHAHAN